MAGDVEGHNAIRTSVASDIEKGACAFISRYAGEARFWAEACLLEFFASRELRSGSSVYSSKKNSNSVD